MSVIPERNGHSWGVYRWRHTSRFWSNVCLLTTTNDPADNATDDPSPEGEPAGCRLEVRVLLIVEQLTHPGVDVHVGGVVDVALRGLTLDDRQRLLPFRRRKLQIVDDARQPFIGTCARRDDAAWDCDACVHGRPNFVRGQDAVIIPVKASHQPLHAL